MSDWLDLSMHISFRSHFHYFRSMGFSHSQISTLHMLHHKHECTVSSISRMHDISKPAASQLLDQLVNMGVIERYESPTDRRVRLHRLTDKGKKMMEESHSARKDWYRSLLDGLSDEELEKTGEALEILNSRMRQFDISWGGCEHGEHE